MISAELRPELCRYLFGMDAIKESQTENSVSVLEKVGNRDDMTELPDELVKQFSNLSEEHDQIIDIVKGRDGVASLKEICIDVYLQSGETKETREIPNKTDIQNKVNKLLRDGFLHRVTGRKGIYSTVPMSAQAPDKQDGNPFS